ncbi:MAG TPA: class I SAM-dependent methyltransferase [Candidatus Binatia bacterium]
MKTTRRISALFCLCLSGCALLDLPLWTAGEVPFVPTPPEVVDRMLELAEVKSGDVLYDVGSGDGRIVVRAAKKYGIRAVGIEIDGDLVEKARDRARVEGVAHLAEFREADAFAADISEASIVTLYMLPEFNFKLKPQLARLKPGARVVSHDFGIEGWPPAGVEKVADKNLGHLHTLYLWKLP